MKKILSIIVIVIQVLIILLFFVDNVIEEKEIYQGCVYETEAEARVPGLVFPAGKTNAYENTNVDKMSIFEAGNNTYKVLISQNEINLSIELWSYFLFALITIIMFLLYPENIKLPQKINNKIKQIYRILPKRINDKRKWIYSIVVTVTNIAGIVLMIRMCNVYLFGERISQTDTGFWEKCWETHILSGSFTVYLECFLMIIMAVLALILLWRKNIEISSKITKKRGGSDEIRKYKELLDEGIITQEEFDIKKKELLKF